MKRQRTRKQKGPTPEDIDRLETALHEAAHVVTAVYLGFPLTGEVSIVGNEENAGSSKIGKPKGYLGDGVNSYFLGEKEVVVNFAGTEAVKLFRELNKIQIQGRFGDGNDIEQAKHCFQELEPIFSLTESEQQFFDRLRSLTGDLVVFAPVYDAILQLANALLERKTLSASESEVLVKRHMSAF